MLMWQFPFFLSSIKEIRGCHSESCKCSEIVPLYYWLKWKILSPQSPTRSHGEYETQCRSWLRWQNLLLKPKETTMKYLNTSLSLMSDSYFFHTDSWLYPLVLNDSGALWVMFPIPVIENTIQRQISVFFKLFLRTFFKGSALQKLIHWS